MPPLSAYTQTATVPGPYGIPQTGQAVPRALRTPTPHDLFPRQALDGPRFWPPAHAGDWLWQIVHYLFEAASTLSRNRLGTREVHVPAERNAAGAQAVDDAKFGAGRGIVQPWMAEQGADRHAADRIPP